MGRLTYLLVNYGLHEMDEGGYAEERGKGHVAAEARVVGIVCIAGVDVDVAILVRDGGGAACRGRGRYRRRRAVCEGRGGHGMSDAVYGRLQVEFVACKSIDSA